MTHPEAMSTAQLTAEMRAIEDALDASHARDGGNETLRAEQASVRRWMALHDERRRRATLAADGLLVTACAVQRVPVPVRGAWE